MLYFRNCWVFLRHRHKMENPADFSWWFLFVYHRCYCSWIIGLLFRRNYYYSDLFLTFFRFLFTFADCCGLFPKCVGNGPPTFRSSWIALWFPGAINKKSGMSLDFYPQIIVLLVYSFTLCLSIFTKQLSLFSLLTATFPKMPQRNLQNSLYLSNSS